MPREVLCDPLRVSLAPGRQRTLSVGERLVGPAGFRMPEEVERVHPGRGSGHVAEAIVATCRRPKHQLLLE